MSLTMSKLWTSLDMKNDTKANFYMIHNISEISST